MTIPERLPAPDKLPAPPKGMTPRSRRLWVSVVGDFDLDESGLALLEEACRSLDRAEEARAIVDSEGSFFSDRWGQPKSHPGLIVERDQRGLFSRLLRELGLDPSAVESRPPRIPGRYDD